MNLFEYVADIKYRYSTYKVLPKVMTAPKVPIIYNWLNGKYYPAWLMHDFNYAGAKTRAEADHELFNDLRAYGSSFLFAACVWLLVRLIGWYHYTI